jgi:hypothetical protein
MLLLPNLHFFPLIRSEISCTAQFHFRRQRGRGTLAVNMRFVSLQKDYVRVKSRLNEPAVWSPAAEKVTKLLAMYHFKLLF